MSIYNQDNNKRTVTIFNDARTFIFQTDLNEKEANEVIQFIAKIRT